MTKNYKAVLKSSLVMLVLFAVAGSGVAQAQECFAYQSSPTKVRAEGKTEAVGSIQLECRAQEGFGQQPIGAEVVISITLNTQITNVTNDDGDTVLGLTYTDGMAAGVPPSLGNMNADDFGYVGDDKEVLSDGGTTITWTIATGTADGAIEFPATTGNEAGETVTINGIMANASALGDGEDVTAEVRVNGVVIKHSPIKLADVTTGLDITVAAASGLQCEAPSDMTMNVATIKFVEGFASALNDKDQLVVAFRNIPEGVTVKPSPMGTGMATEVTVLVEGPGRVISGDLAPLTLITEGELSGLDEDGNVALSTARAGQIVYSFDDEIPDMIPSDNGDTGTPDVREGTDPEKAKEWNELTLTFAWEAGEPTLGMGSVTVSYHPVSDDAKDIPRFASGPTNDVITIEDCTTTLLFPFVTNQQGFNTGLAITNASEGSGSCTIAYSGPDAPEDMMTPEDIAGGEQWVGVLSDIAAEFQGYITASCEFRNAHGFAFITGGGEPPTLAQGYLAVCTNCDDD